MRGGPWTVLALTVVAAGWPTGAEGQELRIETVNGTEREERMAEQVRRVVEEHDLARWILTRDIRIEAGAIPHSHPVLTLSTRVLGDPVGTMAMFVHEQLHWLEDMRPEDWSRAMADYRRLYPEVPTSDEGGARDAESTYRHLLVNDMELQALSTLLGEERARELLAGQRFYRWIYDKVLTDPRVREVALRHGFDAREGAPC